MTQTTWDAEFWRHSPMFEPLAAIARELPRERWPDFDDYARLLAASAQPLVTAAGKPLRFVPPPAARPQAWAERYEPHIYLSGAVPTRLQNWHDLFNALVWLTFPRAKAALNQRHFIELQQEAERERRGSVRDALTLFDESGVIVACSNPRLIELMATFQWKTLFWRRRREVMAQMQCYLFGHGLYEKALQPYVGMTGNGLVVKVTQDFLRQPLPAQRAELDQQLQRYFLEAAAGLTPRAWTPVPLLGMPGWAEANTEESYYDNAEYFRSGRSRLRRGAGGAGAK